jgi:hypothetical protein
MGVVDAAQRQLILAAAADYAAGQAGPDDGREQQQQQLDDDLQQELEDDDLHCLDEGPHEHYAPAWAAADSEEWPGATVNAWGGTEGDSQQQQQQWQQEQQQQQQEEQQGLPLQPVQPQVLNIAAGVPHQHRNNSNRRSSSNIRGAATNDGQSSIRGWLRQGSREQHHAGLPQQQQDGQIENQQLCQQQAAAQPGAVKQQWHSLFNRPGRVLAPEQPLQPKQRPKNQMQLGQGGRLQQPQQQQQKQQPAAGQQTLASLPSTRSGPLPRYA